MLVMYFRLRKYAGDLERKVKSQDQIISDLKGELQLKQSELQHGQHYITELKDLLQTSVKEKAKEKRLGTLQGIVFMSA